MTVYGAHLIRITPWMHWKASSTYTVTRTVDSAALSMGYALCDAASSTGKHIEWDVALVSGTWRLSVIYRKSTAGGIVTPSLNAVDLATQDTYNGSTTLNNVTQWSSIAIAADAVVELKFRTDTKHASASDYDVPGIQAISLLRTGD